MNMTPQQKIKHLILIKTSEWLGDPIQADVTAENVDALYCELEDTQDAISEIRSGQVETDLPSQFSRHYESKEVAAQAPDGSWIGWTYWHGGGKYGEPDAIDWIDEAYSLDCIEEEKMVVVRTFKKAGKA